MGAGHSGDDAHSATVPARAALAGNPSDGHGGAVVAVPLPCWRAIARAADADEFHVVGSEPGDDLWELAAAAGRSLVTVAGAPTEATAARIDITTTIPRSVGLAGSSAIALAVIRALASRNADEAWAVTLSDPTAAAVVAHQAEVAQLGIAAGMQDRLVQAHGEPVLMEFSPDVSAIVLGHPAGQVRHLEWPAGRWLVAHRQTTAEPSGTVHAGLAQRAPSTDAIMVALAAAARSAAAAIDVDDHASLGTAMDRTFELRAELLELDPRHVAMVEAVHQAGGHANYTGSGGAVIAFCPDAVSHDAAIRALEALPGVELALTPFETPSDEG